MTLNKLLRTGAAALGALAVASVTPASAADMYAAPAGGYKDVFVPAPMWAGFYLGAHMGIDWAQFDLGNIYWDDGYSSDKRNLNRSFNTQGGFGGAQLGYNFQSSNWVYGLEVDLGGATMSGGPNEPYFALPGHPAGIHGVQFDGNNNNNGGFYGDVDGRVGYAWGSTLLYAKGGFAWLTSNISTREGLYMGSGVWDWYSGNNNNNTLTGWNIGGGLEWKVSPSWSIKAEYLYFDFTNLSNSCCNDPGGYTWHSGSSDLQVNTVKIGFNYFWNAPPAPLPLK